MKNVICFFVFIFSLPIPIQSQILKGKISDTSGNGIPNVSVFVKETSLGFISGTDGIYQIYLNEGKYNLEFRCLGYETLDTTLVISGKETVKNIELQRRTYMLQEVRVGNKNEDPAYYIIRRAIAMAPYYNNYIKSYTYEGYLKGTFKIDKLPKIGSYTVNDVDMKKYIGKDFTVESLADVSYDAPNRFKLNVKAYQNTLPFEMDSAVNNVRISDQSIYRERIYGCVSPISPKALNYYNYEYLGSQEDGKHWINRIKVIPKKKNPELAEGFIYINEDTWNVVHVDLTVSAYGIITRHKLYYTEIQPDVFVSTSHSSDLIINVLGMFKGSGNNFTSYQYSRLELNSSLQKPDLIKLPQQQVQKEKIFETPKSKTEKKIEGLSSKETLSNKEAYQLAKLFQKSITDTISGKKEHSLDRPGGNMEVIKKIDSLALQRDSAYWAENRVIPLKPNEMESYLLGDSIKNQLDSIRINKQDKKKKDEEKKSIFSTIIEGGKIYSSDKKHYFSYGGLGTIFPEYNFVDGFWIGEELGFGTKLSKKASLDILSSIYYVTARKSILWYAGVNLNYAPMRRGKFSFKMGDRSEDFNMNLGALHIENTFTSVLLGDSYIKFFKNQFLNVQNDMDIVNGLQLHLELDYAKRLSMTNATTYSIFNNHSAEPNIPDNPKYQEIPVNYSLQSTIGITYTPEYYYQIRNGKKQYIQSSYPTFDLLYKKGINTGATYTPRFDQLEFSVRQQIDLGLFDYIYYAINAGKFFSKNEMYFPDFRHFNTGKLTVTGKTFATTFSLLENYLYSTNDSWIQAHINYQSQYLLIKNIPYMQGKIFNEALHLHYLYTPENKNHIEIGYSVGMNELGRIGIFIGFNQFEYKAVGFSISLPLLKEVGHKR